jgi:hypothetical protein
VNQSIVCLKQTALIKRSVEYNFLFDVWKIEFEQDATLTDRLWEFKSVPVVKSPNFGTISIEFEQDE